MQVIKKCYNNWVYCLVSRVRNQVLHWWNDSQIREIRNISNLKCGKRVIFEGVPVVRIHRDALVDLGDDVMLNSGRKYVHAMPYSPVAILAKQPGARIEIGARTRLHASCICAYNSVLIGSRCLIAANCQIMDAGGHGLSFPNVEQRIDDVNLNSKPVCIGDDVWLCEGVKVLPGVTIGKGSVVGAGSVVTKSLPEYCFAVGIPAKVVKRAYE